MGQKIQLIGENLLNDTPAPFEASQVNIKPVSALKEAQAETTFDENKYDNLFSWETVGSVAQLLPSMPLVSGISDAISTRIPEVQLSDSVSFGGGGVNTPWVTNSQQVTDERLAQYAKALNIPAEYWEDLRDSKDMTEVYTKAGKIMKDQQAMTHISTVYGNQALMFGSALIDPTNLLLNGPLNVLSATAKSASVAKSLAVAGALKEANASTNVVKAAAKAGTVGSVAADSALFAATNTGLYVMDANARGMEVTTKDLLMNATMGAIAPVALKGGAFLFDKSVKAFRYMGAKVAQEKFNLKPTEKLDEMTLGEKVHHGDDGVVEPRLADGETQGELFVKDPAIENAMVKSLLDDEPLDTASMTPEGQMAFDFESPRLTQGQTQGELFDGPTGKLPDAPQEGPVVQAPEADANQINLDFEKAEAVQSPDVPQGITTPTELLRARPGYTLDGVRFTPRFKSNVDKALFIVGMEARSKHDGLYMEMLRKTFPKLSDDEIREAGIGIKELHMRKNAKVAITDKNLKAGTQDNLPVEPTWKDAVNPEGKDFEPTHVAVEPVVPKEGLQPEQVAELEKATPEVQQKVVQKVLDQKVADTPLRFNPKDAAQPYARDVEEISSLLEPLVVKDGNRLYTTLKEPLVINTEGASKGVIKLAKAVQNVDGPFVQGTTQDGKPVDFSLDELKAALTKTEPKVETTSYTPGKTAGEPAPPTSEGPKVNQYDAKGYAEVSRMAKGGTADKDGFVSVDFETGPEVTTYSVGTYKDPWGTGKDIPKAEMVKEFKKHLKVVAVNPEPIHIPNEFFPDVGDAAYFKVKAVLPGRKTPKEVILKAWSFDKSPPITSPKVSQSGFITPGVALGLLAGTGLGVYAVANRDELKDDLTNLSAGIGGLMVFGMTRGKGSSVMDALKAPKSLAEVVKMPEVKANPEAVSLKTQGGQEVRLVDIRALPGREYDGTPFHTGEFKLPYFGKVRVSDPAGELSALPRNSKSQTMQSLGMLIASSISGHKTRGALNHTTADVYAQLNAKVAIHQASDAFDKGFKEFSNRNGELTPDFIIAYNSKLVSEFNDEVVRATRGETGVHPAAAKAAKAMSDAKAELLAKGKDLHSKGVERGIVAEGSPWDVMGQLEHDPKYMTRRGNPSGMYDMAAEVGMDKVHLLIKRSMLKENPKLTDDLAQVLAPHWAKVQGAMDFNEGFHVPDMDPNAFLKFVMETTKLAEPKAKELASMFLQHKVGDTTASVLKARTVLDDTFEMETTNLNGETITISMKQLFHQDVRVNHAVWVESMSGILGMAKVSLESGVDLTHQKTFQQILDQAKDELLAEQVPYADAVKEIETIRDIHAKVLGKNNKDGIFKPANKHLRLLNDTTTLLSHANFVFNALPELSNAVMQRGLENVLRDMPELAQVTKAAMGGELADSLARAIITAHGLGDHQTAALQASLEQGTVNAATGKVQLALSQTDKANGRSVATATTKYMTIKGNLQMLSDVARGIRDITPEEWNHFARRGIDEARFNELKDLLVKHTEVDETGLLRTDASGYKPSEMFKEDAEKAMEIHAFTERMGNSAANESSGVGETNRYQHNDIGRVLMKFQGTPLRMWSNLKGQVTNFDASIAASWITVSMSAALSYIMTTYLAHRGDQETLKKKLATQEIAKAAFRNGAFGIAPNVIDLASTMLGQGPVFTSTSGRAGGAQAPLFALKDRVVNTSALIGNTLTGQQPTRAEVAQAVKTPLWALNAFIPFATQSLPKKRADKP